MVRAAACEGAGQDRDAHRRRGGMDRSRQRIPAAREECGTRTRQKLLPTTAKSRDTDAKGRKGELGRRTFTSTARTRATGKRNSRFARRGQREDNVRPNEPRTCLETMTVTVDAEAGVFQERLELEVRMDENLILHAHARSLNRQDDDRCEIHNLEFGLRLRNVGDGANEGDEEVPAERSGGRTEHRSRRAHGSSEFN